MIQDITQQNLDECVSTFHILCWFCSYMALIYDFSLLSFFPFKRLCVTWMNFANKTRY